MGRKSGVDHGGYKRLEKMTKALKRQQVQRRLGGNELLNPTDTGEVVVSLEPDAGTGSGSGSTELPKIARPRKKDPAYSVPERLNDDPGYVDRLFPRNAKLRDDRALFHKKVSHLKTLKVDLIESIDAVDRRIRERKEHCRDLKETHKQLCFQDNIMTERREYRDKIQHEKDRLEKVTLESARLEHYKRTLDAMLLRLHNHQITFVRTQKTYKRAVALQRREADEVSEIAAEVRAERDEAEAALKALKRKMRRKEETWMAKIKELQGMAKQREKLLRDMEEQQRELKRRAKDRRRQQSATETRQHLNSALTKGKLGAFNAHVRAHEMAFTKIRMVTGLQNEGEILERYENQQAYLEDIEAKIRDLTAELRVMEGRVDSLKSEVDVSAFDDEEAGDDEGSARSPVAAAALTMKLQQNEVGIASEKDLLDAMTSEYEEVNTAAKSSAQDLQRLKLMLLSMRQSCENILNEAHSAERCLPAALREQLQQEEQSNAAQPADHDGANATTASSSSDGSVLDSVVPMFQKAQLKINAFMDELFTSITAVQSSTDGAQRIDLDALTIEEHFEQTDALVTANGNNIRVSAPEEYSRGAAGDNNKSQSTPMEDVQDDGSAAAAVAMMPKKGRGGLSVSSAADDLELLEKSKAENALATRLRRIQLATGRSAEEVEEEIKRIPRDHVDKVMDRRALKYAAINLVRKVQKPKKKTKKSDITRRLSAAHD
eukprot:INCI15370.1.p1 GENE.INCI15370.1~~INCI15370.1.p1  ORF type:complete len:718 (+),score=189.83 INCI15370.1:291-2444(+)